MIFDYHKPVLLNKSYEYLVNPEIQSHIIVDGTLGGGGYSKYICGNCQTLEKLICIDKDENAINYSRQELIEYQNKIEFVKGNFGELDEILKSLNIEKITGIVLDLGLSSYQLESEDGFSYARNTLLDMRADKSQKLDAQIVVNKYGEEELENIFQNYGEIGNAVRLAKAITRFRSKKKINTTFDLVDVVKSEYKINEKEINKFLAKIFQAIRIEVNSELKNLEIVLNCSLKYLEKGGRIVVISYHSLEDRIVKNFFKEKSFTPSVSKYRKSDSQINESILKIITKKSLVAESEEIRGNSRARSAKLRTAEKK